MYIYSFGVSIHVRLYAWGWYRGGTSILSFLCVVVVFEFKTPTTGDGCNQDNCVRIELNRTRRVIIISQLMFKQH